MCIFDVGVICQNTVGDTLKTQQKNNIYILEHKTANLHYSVQHKAGMMGNEDGPYLSVVIFLHWPPKIQYLGPNWNSFLPHTIYSPYENC